MGSTQPGDQHSQGKEGKGKDLKVKSGVGCIWHMGSTQPGDQYSQGINTARARKGKGHRGAFPFL
eukprot:gene26289-biopygen15583